jgi:hypothetical protein
MSKGAAALKKAASKTTSANAITPISLGELPRIGAPLAGGEFAGICRGEEGDHALVLLPDAAAKRLTWDKATKWAESLEASLPTRNEQAILFGNLEDRFEAAWYWSCEQYAGDESFAWYQSFGYGNQYYGHKGNALRARAVRRLPIQPFNTSKG